MWGIFNEGKRLLAVLLCEIRPVLVCFRYVSFKVLVERFEDTGIEVEIEFAVSDLPSVDLYREESSNRGSECAKSAVLRCIF